MAGLTVLAEPVREKASGPRVPGSCAMVIFGASGDLTARKLLPALFHLFTDNLLPKCFAVIGCAITPYTDEQFRQRAAQAIRDSSPDGVDVSLLQRFTRLLHYTTHDFSDDKAYEQLKQRLDTFDGQCGTEG